MSDTPWNDAGATTSPEPAPARPARQKRKAKPEAAPKTRKPREAKPREAKPPAEAPAAPKKPRKEKAERAAPATIQMTLKEYADLRVGSEAAKIFVKIHDALFMLSRAARTKVIAEINKVFG